MQESFEPEWNEDGQGEPWCGLCRMLKSDGHTDECLWTVLKAGKPSPTIGELERRLARITQLEKEAAELQAELGGTYTAGEILSDKLAQLEPMPCGHPGSCVVRANEGTVGTVYCGWCEDIKTKRKADLAFHMAAMDGMEAKVKKWEGIAITAHSELDQAEARAEALAALVPAPELLIDLADRWASVHQEDNARALAASIEDARREQGDGGGDAS